MVFNVLARNQDDHTKNIAYLMDKSGRWSLSPAFDVIYAWNPDGAWTATHQMSINGLRDGFSRQDLTAVASRYKIRNAENIIDEVASATAGWLEYAEEAGIAESAAVGDWFRAPSPGVEMPESMQIVSVNCGRIQTFEHRGKSMDSGICKRPQEGAVRIDESGVAGDSINDLEHHGGADQAVYAYSVEDYEWWAELTGTAYEPGTFGENLTIRGMPTNMNIGDRLLIGEVVLEATAPRIPCSTFATRMQDSGFGVAFRKAERPGIYFRVLNPGEVSAGDAVTYVANDASDVSVVDLFRFYYALNHDAEMLRRCLDVPLAERFRVKLKRNLQRSKLGQVDDAFASNISQFPLSLAPSTFNLMTSMLSSIRWRNALKRGSSRRGSMIGSSSKDHPSNS